MCWKGTVLKVLLKYYYWKGIKTTLVFRARAPIQYKDAILPVQEIP